MINTEAVELINTLRKELGISCIIWCDNAWRRCNMTLSPKGAVDDE